MYKADIDLNVTLVKVRGHICLHLHNLEIGNVNMTKEDIIHRARRSKHRETFGSSQLISVHLYSYVNRVAHSHISRMKAQYKGPSPKVKAA